MDPDCLMVGEIFEQETAQQAINAAVLGHVVMATLHARDAVSTITRLRELGQESHQIAAALGVVINQRLIGKLCKYCSSERDIAPIEKAFFETRSLQPPKVVKDAPGCAECSNTGIIGRTGVFEVWRLDKEDYQMILAGDDEESIRAKLDQSGHTHLLDDALAKVNAGIISAAEVMRMGFSLPWDNE
jgi:type II secretory ATPase GspE/PulE/Tfp pilus assembly ATPase PilB-like protein